MKVKALISFVGKITMNKGDERVIEDELTRNDLIQAGYIEEIKKPVTKKKVPK